jgi:hypothetical protein
VPQSPYIDAAFTVAAGLSGGLSRRDIDDAIFERPFHGLRAPAGELAEDTVHAAEAQRQAIRRAARHFAVYMAVDEFASHTTAAVLWGIDLPMLGDERIHVSVPAPQRAPRGAGVWGHQLDPRRVSVVRHPELGVRITDPASTWALLGGLVRHPYDLVAAADSIVHVDRVAGPFGRVVAPALAGIGDLASAIPSGRRGVVALRDALPRVRTGVASRPETWTRLTLVDAGLPEPETDVDVYDASGEFVGCVDLAYPRLRIAVEYEGDHHRTDPVQWQRDIEKHDRLAELGWRVIRVTRAMVFDESRTLVARVRAALRDRA